MGLSIGQEIRQLFSRKVAPQVERKAAPVATQAIRSLGKDTLSLSEAVTHAKQAARAAKAAAAAQTITRDRAAEILRISEPAAFFGAIQYLSADQLRDLAKHEPGVVTRYKAYLGDRQQAWLGDINEILHPYQVEAKGQPKAWESMLGRLDKDTATRLSHGDKRPATPAHLYDLTRARVNTERLDPDELRKMAKDIVEGLRAKHPDRLFDSDAYDTVGRAFLESPDAPYKGRINLRIFDVTDGIKQGAFELQLGPQQLSSFWETPFQVPGVKGEFNIHDAMYKGVSQIKTEKQYAALARGISRKPLSPGEAVTLGKFYVEKTQRAYKEQLAQVISQAQAGLPFDFRDTLTLRTRIGTAFRALEDSKLAPAGLKK